MCRQKELQMRNHIRNVNINEKEQVKQVQILTLIFTDDFLTLTDLENEESAENIKITTTFNNQTIQCLVNTGVKNNIISIAMLEKWMHSTF